jgi:hypothetical protein
LLSADSTNSLSSTGNELTASTPFVGQQLKIGHAQSADWPCFLAIQPASALMIFKLSHSDYPKKGKVGIKPTFLSNLS